MNVITTKYGNKCRQFGEDFKKFYDSKKRSNLVNKLLW